MADSQHGQKQPPRLTLFGQPVRHSLSPRIHADFARQFGLTVEYGLVECSAEEFPERFGDFFARGGHGANITVPFKAQAASMVAAMTAQARACGVINTVYRDNAGCLWGHNTDGAGFVTDIWQRHGLRLRQAEVLIIGAGGAARGLIPALLAEQPARLLVANRGLERLRALQRDFPDIETLALERLSTLPVFDLVINATSMGYAGQAPVLNHTLFAEHTLAYDLGYGAAARAFLDVSKALGAGQVTDGLGMLVEQAALAFSCWFGKMPVTDGIYAQLWCQADC